jgi:hypothetical protein
MESSGEVMRYGTAGVVGSASLGEGISVERSGYVTDEVWQEYITNWKPLEPNDDFHVE